jgi:hypothetical protein
VVVAEQVQKAPAINVYARDVVRLVVRRLDSFCVIRATIHPALIPQKVARSSRPRPPILATAGSDQAKRLALGIGVFLDAPEDAEVVEDSSG